MYIPICLFIFVDDAITNMDLLHENDWLRLAQRPTDTLDKPLTHADLAVNESHTWIKQAFHITTQARPFLSQNGNLLSLSANNYGKTLFCIWAFWIRKLRDYQRVRVVYMFVSLCILVISSNPEDIFFFISYSDFMDILPTCFY